jgi:hypothetical protein
VARKKEGGGPGRPAKDPNSGTQRRAARRTAENLSDSAKAFRDRFVTEYLYDFNATQAYIRAGGKSKRPHKDGYLIRHEAYVSHEIQKAIEAMDAGKIVSQQRAIGWMAREANHFGPDASHGARVSAITQLLKAQALAEGAKQGALAARGGVMVVSEVTSVDDWEKRAAQAQAKLKEEVRK